MDPAPLSGGFAEPARDSARAFRAAMSAMARPGRIERLSGVTPPAPLSPAAGALILTLCDPETPLHLAGPADCAAVRAWVAFHAGAPLAGRAGCRFAVGRWQDLAPLEGYPLGTPDYPDRSATLIVELDRLVPDGARLSGPGIAGEAALSLPETAAFRANAGRFPLGLDLFFTCGDRVAALPRTTRIAEDG